MRSHGRLPSSAELAGRALIQMVPTGLVGPHSKWALLHKIKHMRRTPGRQLPFIPWTSGQIKALKEFIRREEEDGPVNDHALARRALARLVPTGTVGARSEKAVWNKIRRIHSDNIQQTVDEEDEVDEEDA